MISLPSTILSLSFVFLVFLGSAFAQDAMPGDYVAAEKAAHAVLAAREGELSADSVQLAPLLEELAALERAEGKPGLAEPLLTRALALHEKALGKDDLAVAKDLLATVSQALKRYPDGAAAYLRAYGIRMKKWDQITHGSCGADDQPGSALPGLREAGGNGVTYLEALRIEEKNLGFGKRRLVLGIGKWRLLWTI